MAVRTETCFAVLAQDPDRPWEMIRGQMREKPGVSWMHNDLSSHVETRSPSTGHYDVMTKLDEYRRRGDQEIWGLQLDHETLTR